MSDAVFLPFSDGESQLSIGSMIQRYKSGSAKRPGRSGRSLDRSSIVLVGWVAQVDKKLSHSGGTLSSYDLT